MLVVPLSLAGVRVGSDLRVLPKDILIVVRPSADRLFGWKVGVGVGRHVEALSADRGK